MNPCKKVKYTESSVLKSNDESQQNKSSNRNKIAYLLPEYRDSNTCYLVSLNDVFDYYSDINRSLSDSIAFFKDRKLNLNPIQNGTMCIWYRSIEKPIAIHDGDLPVEVLNDLNDLQSLLPEQCFNYELNNDTIELYILINLHYTYDKNRLYKVSVFTHRDNLNSSAYRVKSLELFRESNIHELAIPVIYAGENTYSRISKTNIYSSYMWNSNRIGDKLELNQPDYEFFTYHTYSYYGFFKPSLSDVYNRIPVKIDTEFYVTTEELGLSKFLIGNYQIAISKIWIRGTNDSA